MYLYTYFRTHKDDFWLLLSGPTPAQTPKDLETARARDQKSTSVAREWVWSEYEQQTILSGSDDMPYRTKELAI